MKNHLLFNIICLTLNAQNPDSLDINNLQGTYCLTTMNNNQWYRAFVTNISQESIIVNLFDIGLLADVTLKQVIDWLKLNVLIPLCMY